MPDSAGSHPQSGQNETCPSVFSYYDYRRFLQEMMDHKRRLNPSYSGSALLRQAGFSESSRGYFGLVVAGKRNLSSRSILGLAHALKLNESETAYFEALVHYNQTSNEKDKGYFLDRLERSRGGRKLASVELLRSQYNYFSQWYLVAIRELVGTKNFREDMLWIAKRLRRRVGLRQVETAIQDLLRLKLLIRDESGRLRQSEQVVNFSDTAANFQAVAGVARQLLEQAILALDQDDYAERSVSSVMMACDQSDFAAIREEISQFRSMILARYSRAPDQANVVLNLGIQLTHVTPPGDSEVDL